MLVIKGGIFTMYIWVITNSINFNQLNKLQTQPLKDFHFIFKKMNVATKYKLFFKY